MGRSASDESIGALGTRHGDPQDRAELALGQLGAGSVIAGKYRLEHVLGEGGMGSVWQALNLQLDVLVAIKLLRAGHEMASLPERMKLEARSAARLVHPAIVRVFDIDTAENGDPFIVMELLQGESLADVLDRGRMTPVQAVQTLLPIADALMMAHSKGIVHRDLKPQNVFMTVEGEHLQPKLLDFGIAKLVGAGLPAGSITGTGIMLGSPDYMSPEQARGLTDLDHRTDIWSFCVLLYELLVGSTPFRGENYNALMRAIIDEQPLPIPADSNVDVGLSSIIGRGLSKNREERQESIHALGRELAGWLLLQGVHEDASGGAIEKKWLGRGMHRSSIPAMAEETMAPAPGLEPSAAPPSTSLEAPGGDTLLSASHTSASVAGGIAPHDPTFEVPTTSSLRNPIWMLIAGGAVLCALAAWAFFGRSAGEATPVTATGDAPLPAVALPPTATVSPEVRLAETPPAPSVAPAPASAGSPGRKPASGITPPPARSAKIKPPMSSAVPATAPPTKQPSRDDANELLEAY